MDLGIDGISDATEIGSGGSASVYSATQEALGREVAIKILHVHFGVGDETERRRFQREQMALGRLSDLRGIVPLYASGITESGRPYLIMPLYSGGSLQERIDQDGPIDWRQAASLMIEVARAVQRAHDEGVLHRDLKPANIMIDRELHPVVGDFGVARLVGSTTLFQSRALSTTPAYAPPEVFAGEEPTIAVDVYGLGASLFALINGSPAFVSMTGDLNVLALMRRVETQPVPDLSDKGVPRSVLAVIERSMAKAAAHRHPTAAEWADELEGAVRAATPGEVTPPVVVPPVVAPPPAAGLPEPEVPSPRPSEFAPDVSHEDRTVEPSVEPAPIVATAKNVPTGGPPTSTPRRWPELQREKGSDIEQTDGDSRRLGLWIVAAAAIVLLIAIPIAISLGGDDGDDDVADESAVVAEFAEDAVAEESTDGMATDETAAEDTAGDSDVEDISDGGADFTLAAGIVGNQEPAVRSFLDVYNEATGSSVGFESLGSEFDLRTRLDAGDPPRVASVGNWLLVCEFADAGALVPVEGMGFDPDALRAEHSDFWMDQFRCADGQHYGIPWYTLAKSLVYYHVPTFEAQGYAIPSTFVELIDLTNRIVSDGMTPWCFGFESDASSGWPATDWVEEIVLRQSGIVRYRQWIDHEIPFDDPEIVDAFDAFAEIFFADGAVAGGTEGAIATNFAEAAAPLFEEPPGCLMHKQGSFLESIMVESPAPAYENGEESEIGSFRFPSVSGNDGMIVFGGALIVFDADDATVQAIADWTSPHWQCTLASASGGGIAAHGGHGIDGVEILPAHVGVDPNCFDTSAGHERAAWVVEAIGTNTLALDASDVMPPEVGNGVFWGGMMEWAAGASAENVTSAIEANWPG